MFQPQFTWKIITSYMEKWVFFSLAVMLDGGFYQHIHIPFIIVCVATVHFSGLEFHCSDGVSGLSLLFFL